MRIKFNDSISEFYEIDLIESFCPQDGTKSLSLEIVYSADILAKLNGCKPDFYVGEYDLSAISFEDAKDNYNAVLQKLLVSGWCDSNDFTNFIWY